KKGRLFLFKVFQEGNLPCEPFWLIYIAGFDPKIDGPGCRWFIEGTSTISNAPGKHFLSEAAGRAWFERLAPNFLDSPKREVSADTLKRLAEGRKLLPEKMVRFRITKTNWFPNRKSNISTSR